MCSLAIEAEEMMSGLMEQTSLSPSNPSSTQICCKCAQPSVVCAKRLFYCSPCFVEKVSKGFYSAFFKLPGVRAGSRVVVGLSGGLGSLCLLKLLHELRTHVPEEMHESQRSSFVPRIGHILAVYVSNQPTEDTHIRDLQRIAKGYSDDFIHISLHDIFERCSQEHVLSSGFPSCGVEDAFSLLRVDPSIDKETLLAQCLNSTTTTSREELISLFRMTLLEKVTIESGSAHLFTGESMSRTAINVMLDTCMGKGFNMPLTAALFSARTSPWGALTVYRPLSDMLSEELKSYWSFLGLSEELDYTPDGSQLLGLEDQIKDQGKPTSIHALVDAFITGLQVEYPSTMNTVVRTARKVVTGCHAGRMDCMICGLPLELSSQDQGNWRGSHTMTRLPEISPEAEQDKSGKKEEDKQENMVQLNDHSCYSCQNLYLDSAAVYAKRVVQAQRLKRSGGKVDEQGKENHSQLPFILPPVLGKRFSE